MSLPPPQIAHFLGVRPSPKTCLRCGLVPVLDGGLDPFMGMGIPQPAIEKKQCNSAKRGIRDVEIKGEFSKNG